MLKKLNKKHRSLLLIAIVSTIIASGMIALYSLMPNTYAYQNLSDLNTSRIHYISILKNHVIFIDINPDCKHEIEKVKSSEVEMIGVEPLAPDGYMWLHCDKREIKWAKIESVSTENDITTYELEGRYKALIQTPEYVKYHEYVTSPSSFIISIIRFIISK